MRDGLRAVKNTLDDGALVPGAGAFEVSPALNYCHSISLQALCPLCATCPHQLLCWAHAAYHLGRTAGLGWILECPSVLL